MIRTTKTLYQQLKDRAIYDIAYPLYQKRLKQFALDKGWNEAIEKANTKDIATKQFEERDEEAFKAELAESGQE